MTQEELDQFHELFNQSRFTVCLEMLQEKEDASFIDFVKAPIRPIDPNDAFPQLYHDMHDSDGIVFWIESGESFAIRVFGLETKEQGDEIEVVLDENFFNCYLYSESNDTTYQAKYYSFVYNDQNQIDHLKYRSGHYLKATLVVQRLFAFIEQFCQWSSFQELKKPFDFWIRYDNSPHSNFCELAYYDSETEALVITAETFKIDTFLPQPPNYELINERIVLNNLYLAAKRDDLEKMKALKQQGALIHQKRNGLSLARIALREQVPSKVAYYLCEFETQEDRLLTLQEAICSGDMAVIKRIIEKFQFEPREAINKNGETLIHLAVKSWYLEEALIIEMINYLLTQSIDINQQNFSGETALEKALENDLSKVVAYLIEKGAKPK